MGPKRRRSRRWWWFAAAVFVSLGLLAIGIRLMIARAEPIVRERVIETLSVRFKSPVELAELHVWVADGLHAEGKGLKIFGASDPNAWQPGVQPLISVGEFHFQTSLRNLLLRPTRIDTVFVRGLTMNIPPRENRREMVNIRRRGGKMSIAVSQFILADTQIVIDTVNAEKAPLEFDIGDLRLTDTGSGRPLRFDATLINPRPIGNIHSTGFFGPLNEGSPRETAVAGDYAFTDADLGTIRGLGGILSSEGHYSGALGRIDVEGETDTPDFRIAVSGHRVPLHTDFHAIVDGTDGDVYLEPVRARLRHSRFTARGRIVRMKAGHGRDIELNVVLDHAKIEDLLTLGVKTDPPVMSGTVEMNCRLSLLPSDADITNRLHLAGNFHVPGAHLENKNVQKRIDDLSLRSRGELKQIGTSSEPSVASDLQGKFQLEGGVLSFSALHFQIPGTHADMTGQYSLDGQVFDFHGKIKMEAKLSQMTRGWKSILLKPVDPFFHKDGAETEIPFKITGTRSEPHFGLDFHHKNSGDVHKELRSRQ